MSADLLRAWSGIVVELKRTQGVYPGMLLRGTSVPRLTSKQIEALSNAWRTIGDKLWEAVGEGRPEIRRGIGRAQEKYLVQELPQIILDRSQVPSEVRITSPGTDGGKYVWYPTAAAFYDATSRYVIAMNGAAWQIENFPTAYQRWMSVLPFGMKQLFQSGWYTAETVAPAVKAAVDAGVDAAKSALGLTYYLVKYGPYLAAGGLLVWAAKKMQETT